MQYFQQPPDPRSFGNPQFPEPKASNWFGWILMIIAAAGAGYLFGQRTTPTAPVLANQQLPNDEIHYDRPEEVIEENIEPSFVSLDELNDDIITMYTNDFANLSLAEKLWCKNQFIEHSHLIEWYPALAKKLGLSPKEDIEPTNQKL